LAQRLARRSQQGLFAFRELVVKHRERLATAVTREHGKVLSDAMGEVTSSEAQTTPNHPIPSIPSYPPGGSGLPLAYHLRGLDSLAASLSGLSRSSCHFMIASLMAFLEAPVFSSRGISESKCLSRHWTMFVAASA
jgi:hypothetical protein